MSNDFPELDAADLEQDVEATPQMPLATLNDDFAELRRLRDEDLRLGLDAKQAHADYLAKRFQVWERMEAESVASQKIKGVGNFSQNEVKWKPAIQDKKRLLAWLREEMPSAVEVGYSKKLINQLVAERMRDGRELPPGLGAYPEKIVSIRKA